MSGKPSVLTLNDAIHIRVLASRGYKQSDLAKQYNTTEGNISAIVNRRTHNHGLAEQIRRRKQGGPGKPKEKLYGTF
jgi:transcriptional regulator